MLEPQQKVERGFVEFSALVRAHLVPARTPIGLASFVIRRRRGTRALFERRAESLRGGTACLGTPLRCGDSGFFAVPGFQNEL